MKNTLNKISECKYDYLSNGKVVVTFENCITGETFKREYKNISIASAQATKFANKIICTFEQIHA